MVSPMKPKPDQSPDDSPLTAPVGTPFVGFEAWPKGQHFQLHSQCGICGWSFEPSDRVVGLVLLSPAQTLATPTFTYPPSSDSTTPHCCDSCFTISGHPLCQKPSPGCLICADSLETVTLHRDCLLLFRRFWLGCDEGALSQAARFAAWKRPWRRAPWLFLPEVEGVSRAALAVAERWDGDGDGLLRRLSEMPQEVVSLIREFSEESEVWRFVAAVDVAGRLCGTGPGGHGGPGVLLMPLGEVDYWEHGVVLVPGEGAFPEGSVTRVSIDAQGVRAVERLVGLGSQSRWHGMEKLRFVFFDEDSIQGVMAEFQDGLMHLIMPNDKQVEFWDTPTPVPISRFGDGWESCPHKFFHAIDLSAVSGLTFVYTRSGDNLISIHGHTPGQPSAKEPPDLGKRGTSDPYRDPYYWAHVPITAGDEILAMAVAVDPAAKEPGHPSFYIRTKLAGDLFVGRYQKSHHFAAVFSSGPATLFYGRREQGGVVVVGAYPEPTLPQNFVSFAQRNSFGPQPQAFAQATGAVSDCFYSEAPLDSVIRAKVYRRRYSPTSTRSTGILLEYTNGSSRVAGECRVGVDKYSTLQEPTALFVLAGGRTSIIKFATPKNRVNSVCCRPIAFAPKDGAWFRMEGLAQFWTGVGLRKVGIYVE